MSLFIWSIFKLWSPKPKFKVWVTSNQYNKHSGYFHLIYTHILHEIHCRHLGFISPRLTVVASRCLSFSQEMFFRLKYLLLPLPPPVSVPSFEHSYFGPKSGPLQIDIHTQIYLVMSMGSSLPICKRLMGMKISLLCLPNIFYFIYFIFWG